MTVPQPAVDASWALGESQPVTRPRWQIRVACVKWGRVVLARLAGPARMLPGLAAAGCAFAGSWLVWSLGVALLVAAALLLVVDARTPRG